MNLHDGTGLEEAGVVGHDEIRSEEAKTLLRHRPELEILIVEGKDIRIHGFPSHQRHSLHGSQVGHQVPNEGPRVLHCRANLVRVITVRPLDLGYDDLHIWDPSSLSIDFTTST